MGFRRNYLPSQSQPWTREVQSRVEAMERDVVLSDINNRTRDDQLQSSYNRLDSAFVTLATQQTTLESQQTELTEVSAEADTALQTAITANGLAVDAIRDVVNLSSPGGPSVNASNVTAGSINGLNITGGTLATSGLRHVKVISSEVEFYDGNGALSGRVTAGEDGRAGTMYFGTGVSGVFAYNGGVDIQANGVVNIEATLNVLGGNSMDVSGNLSAQTVSSTNFSGTTNTSIAGNTTGSFGGNVFINTSGNMFRSTQTSSRDAKENISPIQFDTDAFISVNPVEFNYKAEAVSTAEEAALPQLGFILEDFEDAGVSEHLVIPTNELDDYKGLRYDKLYMYLHKVVQTQNETIKTLEARLDALEAK